MKKFMSWFYLVLGVARCTKHYCWCIQQLLKLPKLPLLPAVADASSFSLFMNSAAMNSASIYCTQHPAFINGTMFPFAHCLLLFSLRCAVLPSLQSVWFDERLAMKPRYEIRYDTDTKIRQIFKIKDTIRLEYVNKIYKKLYIVSDFFLLEQLDFSLE